MSALHNPKINHLFNIHKLNLRFLYQLSPRSLCFFQLNTIFFSQIFHNFCGLFILSLSQINRQKERETIRENINQLYRQQRGQVTQVKQITKVIKIVSIFPFIIRGPVTITSIKITRILSEEQTKKRKI